MDFCLNVLKLRKEIQFWADDIQMEYNVSALINYGTNVSVVFKGAVNENDDDKNKGSYAEAEKEVILKFDLRMLIQFRYHHHNL